MVLLSVCVCLFILAQGMDCSIFAKGNSEKILFLQTGWVFNACSCSYFLGFIFHDLYVHLINETSSLKTICSNTTISFLYLSC